MQGHYNIDAWPHFKNCVITIGTFDGVHIGHTTILQQLKEEAAAVTGETVVITFHPHPRKIVGDVPDIKILTTLDEKISLIEKQDIDHLVVVPFNEAFSQLSADAYIKNFLVAKFRPHTIIIGYDHHFGHDRTGNFSLLETYGKAMGFLVKEIPVQVIETAAISSTRIRKALLQNDIATASHLLGYDYFFSGTIISGDKIGRTIGYPTANIQLNNTDKLVPADGVYTVYCSVTSGKNNLSAYSSLKGMMYIGSRPVVNRKRRVIEVNIFDFNEDIYECTMQVTLKAFIRGDMPLTSLQAVQQQLALDKQAVLSQLV
jgi:riboflavin kinase/FMN adenylyltransferase